MSCTQHTSIKIIDEREDKGPVLVPQVGCYYIQKEEVYQVVELSVYTDDYYSLVNVRNGEQHEELTSLFKHYEPYNIDSLRDDIFLIEKILNDGKLAEFVQIKRVDLSIIE